MLHNIGNKTKTNFKHRQWRIQDFPGGDNPKGGTNLLFDIDLNWTERERVPCEDFYWTKTFNNVFQKIQIILQQ